MPFALASLLLALSLAPAGTQPGEAVGCLRWFEADGKGGAIARSEPYVPREGDIVFFDDASKWWGFLYKIGRTGPPFHTGLVVKKPDGSMGILESGPDDTLWVFFFDITPRLHQFTRDFPLGNIQVRRCKVPLTPEQSAALTQFAVAQTGKRYAMWRLLLQGTPFKSRGHYRAKWFADTYFDRQRWLCTEIVVSGATLAGLMDKNVIKATNTYPLDIIDDRMYPLSAVYDRAGLWLPHPEPSAERETGK
jgi:hypothetical protein